MNFIKRLTEDYREYVDLIQPIQVAVYEMKLGLAIALSGSLQREYLKKIKEDDINRVLGAIYAFMQFPSGSFTERVVTDVTDDLTNYTITGQLGTLNSCSGDVDMLKKLAAMSSQLNVCKVAGKVKSLSEMLASVHHIFLVRTADCVSCSLVMDKSSYASLKDTFDHFTSMWINMKYRLKAKESDDSQYFKFKSRMISIDDIFKDVPLLSDMESEDSILDNEEKLEHEFFKITESIDDDNGVVEDNWDLIPESALKCIVTIHDQLFGSPDLFEKRRKCQVSDAQKVQSFIESYELGTRILKDLPELTCSMFDEKLMPEHLFRVCLEYQRSCAKTHQDCSGYNAYKDPNPPVLFKMVESLTTLQERVNSYLDEWPDHPGLLKILDLIASLLAMPLSTPISKVLLGLQLLAGKAQTLQENDSKFFVKDHLASIFLLVYSWQRLELDCWPILLEEVQTKYELNAAKLWFPLRALLTQTSGIPVDDDLSIIRSVEEFVQTSSLGEYKRRLHILFAFHGEISAGASLGSYSSNAVKKIQNILYSVFGYYMQFLSLVHGKIEEGKKNIEKELKDHVKLYSWEQAPYSSASIENFKRTRQKIFKLLQRFNDILKSPVIFLLNEEATSRKIPCWLDPQRPESHLPVDSEKFNKRFLWYHKWASETSLSLQTLQQSNGSTVGVPTAKDMVYDVKHWQNEIELNDRLQFFWISLERICGAANFGSTVKHGKKNQKKTALSNLFKTLEECGLSKHRPMSHEWGDELAAPSPLFLEQSYDSAHLLQQINSQKMLEDVSINHSTLLNTDNWKHANQQYFKCLAMMQQLRQVSLKFNKDLGLEEVNKAMSFMSHLLTVLSEQRHLAYNLFDQRNQFKHAIFLLGSGGKSKSLSSSQNVLLSSMWQQKKLFDAVITLITDSNLLLRSFKDCHYNSCNNFIEVEGISSLLGKFILNFSESKELLDECLLGSTNIFAGAYKSMPHSATEMEQLFTDNCQHIDSLLDGYLPGSNNIFPDAYKSIPLATTEMEQLFADNCQLIDSLREDMKVLCHRDLSVGSVKKVLISRLEELLEKGKMAMENRRHVEENHKLCLKLEASYIEILKETFMLVVGAVRKLTDHEVCSNGTEKSPVGNVASWKDTLQTCIMNLKLDDICVAGEKIRILVRLLVDYKPDIRTSIELHLMHLHAWLSVILSSAEGILSELLEAHITTSEMTLALGDLFIHLFTDGFGSTEDTAEDADELQQDAVGSGTGMGEGDGQKSVSSDIDDESQLGDSKDLTCKADPAPKNDDKAVEMQDGFNAQLSDVSEDLEGKDSGGEDEDTLDNQMGDTGDASEVVGKKSWDKDEDDDPKTSIEKYESGSSAKGTQQDDREMRAKDDGSIEEEDPMEMDSEEGKNNNLEHDPSTHDETELNTDEVMDKADAYDDRTGPELPEPENDSIDVDMVEQEQTDEINADNEDIGTEEAEQADQRLDASDDMEEGDMAQHSDGVVDNEGEHVEDANTDAGEMDSHQLDKADSLMPLSQGLQPDNMQINSNGESEANLANSSDMHGAVAPSVNFSGNEVPNMEISMPNTGNDSILSSNSKPDMQNDAQQHIKQTNPFRSIGDALEDWKERARVSADTQDHQPETGKDSSENTTEFRYVPEGEESTSQALGAATADQINYDNQINQSFLEDESCIRNLEHSDERTPDNPEVPYLQTSQALPNKSENANELDGREIQTDASVQNLVERTDHTFQDLVSFKQPPADDKIALIDLTTDRELPSQMDLDITDAETKRSNAVWKNLELATMKLSQELAEQLRLVMEPTLASKLQGDYRTGKRINMKKVIPYIASHFRRDKIWLRRTKPNKRNYQVVIAVDDSRSMSEGKCGKFAIEALVTVCRAMSQLEVGQFAVASFGKKGNVSVLHDFDQIFNSEAGVNVISSLSFEQDNKIEDEPVSDLLTHLNVMLDTAVARARTPSGQNPLQQLILIISDGKFHEKENLRRHVRDVLNRKRMVAYVLLDSPEDSIINLKEACFRVGEKVELKKYMDSFPFPYYVMLQNIEALPRTLADLLRQWFELMQSANE
ncbi:ribosome export associated1 [Zea mays]|nr:ribosome export associated1 [Zea mays]